MFIGYMKDILSGINVGDELFDNLPLSDIFVCKFKSNSNVARKLPKHANPDWLDIEKVRRGQTYWRKHLGRTLCT